MLSAAAMPAVIGMVLLLRTRTFAHGTCRLALTAGGMASTAICFVVSVVSLPTHAHSISALAVAAGVAVLVPRVGVEIGPAWRRIGEIADYAALAAIVPIACWTGGVFALVRGMSVT